MVWEPLGSVQLNSHEWRLLSGLGASEGGSTFRLTHSWNFYPVKPIALMGLYFTGLQGIGSVVKIFPSSVPVIVQLQLPKPVQEGEFLSEVLFRRTFPYDTNSGWTVSVEVWNDSVEL